MLTGIEKGIVKVLNVAQADVEDGVISSKELNLLRDIANLTKEKGYCFASNEYFMAEYNVTDRTIRRRLDKLIELGYVNRELKFDFKTCKRTRRLTVNKAESVLAKRGIYLEAAEEAPTVNPALADALKGVKGEKLTENEIKALKSIEKKYDLSLIIECINRSAHAKSHIAWIMTVLADWASKGIQFVSDLTKAQRRPKRQAKRQAVKRVIRKEVLPSEGYFKRDENGLLKGVYGSELNHETTDTRSDEEKVAHMKELQAKLLAI